MTKDFKFIKKGFIFKKNDGHGWWKTHAMASAAIMWNGVIRVYFGGWDEYPVSRITYMDLDPKNPSNILAVHHSPILDIGEDGMFDDNGVFPAHASVIDGKVHLYYTGFQKGHKVAHYNFGGLAISDDGEKFERVSKSPILDRKDEGLLVRAGQSVIKSGDKYKSVYSIGNGFKFVGGKDRPTYDIAYQESDSVSDFSSVGEKILSCDYDVEHGLGRPQIIEINGKLFVFYTRRKLDMKYFIGCASIGENGMWIKNEEIFSEITHSKDGFDSEMIYFPSVVLVPESGKCYLFYNGNGFGEEGIGYLELVN